jgi:hypothetical protein
VRGADRADSSVQLPARNPSPGVAATGVALSIGRTLLVAAVVCEDSRFYR